jgi:hypothetical protein
MKQLIPEPSSAPGIDSSVCEHDAKPTIDAFLTLFETTSPSLRQIWAAMDFAWDQIGIPLCQRSCPPLCFSSISQVGGIG